jgi:arylsulfatase A-like enzyme
MAAVNRAASRSIVARRAFQAARAATDRDGDGFSPYFGGGDVDDADASVNPMAAETPANGVDDNCIGGDLARSDQARGSLFVPVSAEATRAPEPPPAAPATAAGARNILILSVDCLRGDHLSCYGYPKPTSPNIDRFAAESLVFENAYAQGTNTGHSFTSLYRSSYADDIFDSRIPTFAKVARDRGFQTHFVNAIRTDAWLNANRWDKYKELMGDFEIVHSEGDRFWNAEALTDRAIETIDGEPRDVPQLTWVHYFDCHRPRRRHPEHDFGRSAAGVFDSNVAFVDRHLGRLLDHLRENGRLDDTIVFIIADHGEAFMEHGAVDHSNKPYNNNTLVPLIVHAPGAAPARFSEPCGLIDVGPTALAFAGIPSPAYYRGVDLLAAARAGGPPHRLIVSETPRNLIESSFYSWALVDWPLKVMWDVRSNTTEIYDIEADPGEQHNLVDRHPELATRLRAELGAWLDRETARTGAVGPGDEGLDDGDGD